MGARRSVFAQHPSTTPFAEWVRAEQVEMLYDRNRLPAILSVPFGIILCAFAWAHGQHAILLAWFVLKMLLVGVRLGLDRAYRHRAEGASAETWAKRYIAALGADGLVWALLIVLLADPDYPLAPMMVAVVICLGAVGVVAATMDRRACVVFATALLLPGAVRLLLLGTQVGAFGGVSLLFLLVLIIDQGLRVSATTLAHIRLRFEVMQTRDMALASDRTKTDFLATMSHELRTPLNAVIGMATLLADSELRPDQRERLDVIRASSETLLTLIGDILDVTKIEAGKLEVESVPVNLARVVEEALDQVAPAAFAKGLELGHTLSGDCPVAVASDPTRVRQILANLLGNAVKFTSSGSVTVDVAAVPRDGGYAEVTFSVRDTGIGIEPASLERLFTPFTQADTTTTRKYGGSGLGLAICKSLSELLGGTVGVESTVGKGSTFRFSLVGKVVDQPRLRALPVNVGAPVSVVSEDNAARSILARHVESLGLIASPVASVAAALEAAAAHESDLLLFDARGSVEETKSVLRMVRAASATLPILLLASPRTPALGGSELADALVATLFKPVKTGRLLEVIEALLAGQPVPARASSIDDLEPPPPATTSGGTVLVVDDNALNRRVAIEMVRRLGLSAQSVASGAEAIAAVGRARFDYVLMDVQMPDMDGFEATRRILEVAEKVRKTKPRVIAMTANALPGDRERCLAAGMTDYITKPVRPAALAAALKRRYDGAAGDGERSGITDVLDAQVLEDLRMLEETSGATLIADLAAQFRVDVPARIEELQAAARGSDVVSLRSIAHRLRGSAGAVGANRVFVTATEIESSAGLMAAPGMEALVAQLAKEATRAIDAFDRLLERMKREKGAPSESPELPP